MFQFTPLMRGATSSRSNAAMSSRFQFTPLMRGATSHNGLIMTVKVSIHAPHARGDAHQDERERANSFNSRPSCEGRQNPCLWLELRDVSIHAPHHPNPDFFGIIYPGFSRDP